MHTGIQIHSFAHWLCGCDRLPMLLLLLLLHAACCMRHTCLNYAENVTLIIGIYGVCAAFDMIDDNAGQTFEVYFTARYCCVCMRVPCINWNLFLCVSCKTYSQKTCGHGDYTTTATAKFCWVFWFRFLVYRRKSSRLFRIPPPLPFLICILMP